MSAGRKSGGGGRRMTEEETELWRHATRAMAPIKAKGRANDLPAGAGEPSRNASVPSSRSSKPAAPQKPVRPAALAVIPPPLSDFDRRKARQISSGKVVIDARLDLHGLRQRDAHARLRAFLLEAFAQGHRTALIITGKGEPSHPPEPQSYQPEVPSRGVLRRAVPLWLEEPELRSVVSGFTVAGIRHGGNGALYVQLRKPARGR
jgi:DNA-nicking Smr family endonuclease